MLGVSCRLLGLEVVIGFPEHVAIQLSIILIGAHRTSNKLPVSSKAEFQIAGNLGHLGRGRKLVLALRDGGCDWW